MKGLLVFIGLMIFTINVQAVEGTHGMVIFGKEKLFAYHLPMFHQLHNKQMVFTFDLPATIKAQLITYEEGQFLTFVPAPFDLEKFIAQPFALKGDLYSGHFEKNGSVILAGITLSNPKIIYVKDLVKPISGHIETYEFFGTNTDIYALHLLDGGTKLDQIFKLSGSGNIDQAMTNYTLANKSLLQLGNTYSVTYLLEDSCLPYPTRTCGSKLPYTLADFKTESLYFTDEVM
jgi:hypothetical protein